MNFFTNPPYLRDVQELAGTYHVHRLILFSIEVPRCCVHGDDEFRIRCKRTFQEPVVRFVPDNTELGQRIANGKALDDFGDKSPDDCQGRPRTLRGWPG
jgi:hypothetical protein